MMTIPPIGMCCVPAWLLSLFHLHGVLVFLAGV